jgi:hypothetical protein
MRPPEREKTSWYSWANCCRFLSWSFTVSHSPSRHISARACHVSNLSSRTLSLRTGIPLITLTTVTVPLPDHNLGRVLLFQTCREAACSRLRCSSNTAIYFDK